MYINNKIWLDYSSTGSASLLGLYARHCFQALAAVHRCQGCAAAVGCSCCWLLVVVTRFLGAHCVQLLCKSCYPSCRVEFMLSNIAECQGVRCQRLFCMFNHPTHKVHSEPSATVGCKNDHRLLLLRKFQPPKQREGLVLSATAHWLDAHQLYTSCC